MTDTVIAQKCLEEIELRTWGVTDQYLNIHSLVYEEGKPTIERIDRDKDDGTAIAYIPFKDERFYLAISLKANPDPEIIGIDTEANHSVYFRATSETLHVDQLTAITTLTPSRGWNKGDVKGFGKGKGLHKCSGIEFLPNPEPDEFEDKLNSLLSFLEQDEMGVRKLVELAHGYIQAAIIFHNGNTMLGGPHINKTAISRMHALHLAIDFDLYAEGNLFK